MPRMLRRAAVLGATAHVASKPGGAKAQAAQAAQEQEQPAAPPPTPVPAEAPPATDLIEPGSAAAVALIERVWAVPSRDAITRAGGVPVSSEWVHPLDLVEVGLRAADDLESV